MMRCPQYSVSLKIVRKAEFMPISDHATAFLTRHKIIHCECNGANGGKPIQGVPCLGSTGGQFLSSWRSVKTGEVGISTKDRRNHNEDITEEVKEYLTTRIRLNSNQGRWEDGRPLAKKVHLDRTTVSEAQKEQGCFS